MLLASELHGSLEDPILDSINFLNEIMARFPSAISFAPGAPNPSHLKDVDIGRYINKYVEYLCRQRHISAEQAQYILCQYGPARGLINELVAAAVHKDKGMPIPKEAIVITVGAQEAMLLVLRVLFRSSQAQLAVVNPCFVGILGAARLLDIDVIGIDETAQGIDLEQLENACIVARRANRPIKALYVAPDYSNPAGTVLEVSARQQLLALAERYDFFLLEDNAYGFTAPPGEERPMLKELDKTGRVILIGTFAKICLPGARVGYVIADQWVEQSDGNRQRLADAITAIKSMVTVNTSPICQALIGGMLLEHDGSLALLEQEKSTFYRYNLQLLLDALKRRLPDGISWNAPQGGFFVRLRLPVIANMALLERSAADFGVLWTPMSLFYLNNAGDYELRLSCSYLTPRQIEEGVERLAAFLQHL